MKNHPLYLNGEWRYTEETSNVVNPATSRAFATVSVAGREMVARALKDAHAAWEGWRKVPGKMRGDLLRQVADQLEKRRDMIARIITQENGKPVGQSQGEVSLAMDHLRWFAEEARRVYGRIVPHQADDKRHLVIKSPVGVVGAITPWNFPLMLAVRKVGAALAAGCPVVLKPSSRTPLSAVAFAECVEAAGVPKGVFQLVMGKADEIAREFLDNPLCRKISFTGSTETGRKLIQGAAEHVKPLSLELGGNAAVLVFDDCNVPEAVKATVMAKFRNTGQSCIAANRIYVQRRVYRVFLDRLVEEVRQLHVGDGLDTHSQVGPLIDEEALVRAVEHVNDAVKGGAKLLCGGNCVMQPAFFLEPTVLADVPRTSLCMFEETFAPIAPVTVFDTEKEAVDLANNSNHGLAAYVFTRDLSRMFRVAEALEAGIIGVNEGLPTTSQCPFGGMKQSGWGRELGSEGVEAFLETKHVSIALD
ncbi:MAG TPA: NAD-dependent succinate-semialdehyde dehydrogenase [Verrucomicrobiota bacterium]|nr:NAD-dependent succinate-semialdehyde dehydrogenase [Verrucomicrobiota bacterium]